MPAPVFIFELLLPYLLFLIHQPQQVYAEFIMRFAQGSADMHLFKLCCFIQKALAFRQVSFITAGTCQGYIIPSESGSRTHRMYDIPHADRSLHRHAFINIDNRAVVSPFLQALISGILHTGHCISLFGLTELSLYGAKGPIVIIRHQPTILHEAEVVQCRINT
ncbi:hypothetical protein D3C86_1444260 [compost metagenome]